MLFSEFGCTPEREQQRKSNLSLWAGWPTSFCYIHFISMKDWSVFDLGMIISKCSFFSMIALALSSSNSPTLNKPVKPKGNMNVVLSPFNIYEGPAKRLQTLIIVAIEIFPFS